MRKAIAALACVSSLLYSCASIDSALLSEDTARISTEGNGPADRDKVIRDALAEAARLTTANGYRYFVVLTADDLSHTVTVRTPGRLLYNQPPRSAESLEPLADAPTPRAARTTRHLIGSRSASSPRWTS